VRRVTGHSTSSARAAPIAATGLCRLRWHCCFSPKAPRAVKTQPSDSVFDFNDQLYAATRYKYFNYRVFAFSQRFEEIEKQQYGPTSFRTGMITEKQP
jgi:hypothetical protein